MADALLDLIQEYRQQMAVYNKAPEELGTPEDDALAYSTWRPAYDRLCTNPPAATSREGAVEAIRLVIHEEKNCGSQPDLTVNVLQAALSFLEGAVDA